MKVGTRSVLIGAHCFFLHPLFVALGWWKLYRWAPAFEGDRWPALLDPRWWLCAILHDVGYLGKAEMDDFEGECHPFAGAFLVSRLLRSRQRLGIARLTYIPAYGQAGGPLYGGDWLCRWGLLALTHSRHLTKALNGFPSTASLRPSRLCFADKLVPSVEPWFIYLPRVMLTGEIEQYLAEARDHGHKVGIRSDSRRAWYRSMADYMARWVEEHRDGKPDTWTSDRTRREAR